MNDRQIITLYNQRNERAITLTEEKYGSYCFAIARNILSDDEDALECVNDTLLRAWESIPPKQPASLKLFLAKITRNLSFTRYREKHREKRGGGEMALALEEIGEISLSVNTVHSEVEGKEMMQAVGLFLRTLPSRDRNLFVRRYFYVESTREIAKRYLLKEDTVLKILSRTREKLKEYLKTRGYWE